MNCDTYSAECLHKMHSACDYEDCACACHMYDDDDDYEELWDAEDELGGYF